MHLAREEGEEDERAQEMEAFAGRQLSTYKPFKESQVRFRV